MFGYSRHLDPSARSGPATALRVAGVRGSLGAIKSTPDPRLPVYNSHVETLPRVLLEPAGPPGIHQIHVFQKCSKIVTLDGSANVWSLPRVLLGAAGMRILVGKYKSTEILSFSIEINRNPIIFNRNQ